MDILQIVALGIIAAILSLVLKEYKPELSIHISIVTGVLIFILVLGKLNSVLSILKLYVTKSGIDILYFSTILKVIAIAYITEFGAQICRDSNEGSIASKIEFAGKVIIMVMAVPIYVALLDIITKIMP